MRVLSHLRWLWQFERRNSNKDFTNATAQKFMMSVADDLSAKDFLEKKFNDVKGHVLLKQAASGVAFDSFRDAFDFTFDEKRAAENQGVISAQFDYLLGVWYDKGPTVKDLREALTRWGKIQLLRDLGLEPVPASSATSSATSATSSATTDTSTAAPATAASSSSSAAATMSTRITTHYTAVMLLVQANGKPLPTMTTLRVLTREGIYQPHECNGAPRLLLQRPVAAGLFGPDFLPVLALSFATESRRHAALIVIANDVSARVRSAVKQLFDDCGATHFAIVCLRDKAENATPRYAGYKRVRSGDNPPLDLQLSHPEADFVQEMCAEARDAEVNNVASVEFKNDDVYKIIGTAQRRRMFVGDVLWRAPLDNDKESVCAAYAGVCVAALAMIHDNDPLIAESIVTIELSYSVSQSDIGILTLSQVARQLDGQVEVVPKAGNMLHVVVREANGNVVRKLAGEVVVSQLSGGADVSKYGFKSVAIKSNESSAASTATTSEVVNKARESMTPDVRNAMLAGALSPGENVVAAAVASVLDRWQGVVLRANSIDVATTSSSSSTTSTTIWSTKIAIYLKQTTTFELPTPLDGKNYVELYCKRRDDEKNSLVDAESALCDATLTMAFVEGEAGSGKSSILRRLMARRNANNNNNDDDNNNNNDNEFRLFVRCDLLWRVRDKLLQNASTRDAAIVDAHIASLTPFVLSDEDKLNVQRELLSALSKGRCVLLLDALDEVPPVERATREFGSFLQALCRSSSTTTTLFRRVVMTCRPAVVNDDALPRDIVRFTIAPMDDESKATIGDGAASLGEQYIKSLLVKWEKEKSPDEIDKDTKATWSKRSLVGPNVTPLMLLMLARLHFKPPGVATVNSFEHGRWSVYESFLVMLLERTVEKDTTLETKILPSWAYDEKRKLRVDFADWLCDMLSLIGAVFHKIGDVTNVGALVSKYDVALALELSFAATWRDTPRRLSVEMFAPPSCPAAEKSKWIATLNELCYQTDASKHASFEGMMMWVLTTAFGLVSTQTAPDGHGSLNDRLLFSHRSFQEFLTARALLRYGEGVLLGGRVELTVLANHDWVGRQLAANQWWDNVWLFVAARRGVVGVFELMMRVVGTLTLAVVSSAEDVDVEFWDNSKGVFEKQRVVSNNNNDDDNNLKSFKFICNVDMASFETSVVVRVNKKHSFNLPLAWIVSASHVELRKSFDGGASVRVTFDFAPRAANKIKAWQNADVKKAIDLWRIRIVAGDGVDDDDLGYVRLVTLLRCVANVQCKVNDNVMLAAVFNVLETIARLNSFALCAILARVGTSEQLKFTWSQLDKNDKRRVWLLDYLSDDDYQRYICLKRNTLQSSAVDAVKEDVVVANNSTKQDRNVATTSNASAVDDDRQKKHVDGVETTAVVENNLSSSSTIALQDSSIHVDVSSWLSMSLSEKLTLLRTNADNDLRMDIFASADALRNVVAQSRDANANDLASIWSLLGQIVSRQPQEVQRMFCAVLHESSSLEVLLNVSVNWNWQDFVFVDDHVVQLALVSAFHMRDGDWEWLVKLSVEWRHARYMPAGLLRQIDSARAGEPMPLVEALKKVSTVDQLYSVAPLWLLSRRRCCLLSLYGGASWQREASVDDTRQPQGELQIGAVSMFVTLHYIDVDRIVFKTNQFSKLTGKLRELSCIKGLEQLPKLQYINLDCPNLARIDTWLPIDSLPQLRSIKVPTSALPVSLRNVKQGGELALAFRLFLSLARQILPN